jgi:glutamine synthetase
MPTQRFHALRQLSTRTPVAVPAHTPLHQVFGANVFTPDVMQRYISEDAFEALQNAIADRGVIIDRKLADEIANGMKTWALSKGASHYTHWFQPLTGLTAEKHDAFFSLNGGKAMETFSGGELAQQEPDASSFPSGGIRNTFEARGYTAWDPSSPAFIWGSTLCIPSIFISYTGEALDYKGPLLSTIALIDKAATDVCEYFERGVTKVNVTLGPEQEYFLVDRAFYEARPDLVMSGRSIFGAPPARGQQLEDHYFGSIPTRVLAFMQEFEQEALLLGIPLKTRHNEVAPSQFECAPFFEEMNIAVDHNQLLMDIMEKVALRHNLKALLHEKPFAGINGSGKHNNWSLGTNTGRNLFSPGKTPKDNLQFLTFVVCTIKAIHVHADLLRASIAAAGNDHRLGANEAPPAIISVFMGGELDAILNELETTAAQQKINPKSPLKLNISRIPQLLRDNTDRNRTSPFAFTGNKFEFRAVGSSANIAVPMVVLNIIVADQLITFKKDVDARIEKGEAKEVAILEVLRKYTKESKAIRFEGNGYSEEWKAEAKKRGLNNITNTPEALDAYISKETVKLFEKHKILTERELHARWEIKLEQYVKKIGIETQLAAELVQSQVLPAAVAYQRELISACEGIKSLGFMQDHYQAHIDMVKQISLHINAIHKTLKKMDADRVKADGVEDMRKRAVAYNKELVPALAEVRTHVDALENMVDDQKWPLPKYREMLFLK